jgi:hypothetical protein
MAGSPQLNACPWQTRANVFQGLGGATSRGTMGPGVHPSCCIVRGAVVRDWTTPGPIGFMLSHFPSQDIGASNEMDVPPG